MGPSGEGITFRMPSAKKILDTTRMMGKGKGERPKISSIYRQNPSNSPPGTLGDIIGKSTRKVHKKMTNILLLIRGLPPTFKMNHAGPRQALPNPDCFLVAQPVAEPLCRRGRRCLILMKCENPCQSSQKRVGVAVLRGVLQPEAPKGFYRQREGFGMDMSGLACPFSLHGANLLLSLLPARG